MKKYEPSPARTEPCHPPFSIRNPSPASTCFACFAVQKVSRSRSTSPLSVRVFRLTSAFSAFSAVKILPAFSARRPVPVSHLFALNRAQSRSIAVTKGFKKNEPPRPCPLMPPHFLRFSFCALPRLACRAPVAAFELSPAAINYLRSTINCSQRPCSAKRLDETRPLPTLPASVSDMAPWVNHPQQLPFLRRR